MSRDEMIEITAELRQDRDTSWAVWQGDMTDDEHGNGKEIWIFLPKKCCEKGPGKNEWQVPEWLAMEKGLI